MDDWGKRMDTAEQFRHLLIVIRAVNGEQQTRKRRRSNHKHG